MQKFKMITLVISLISVYSEFFGQCLPNGITTNPSAPVNNQLPIKKNLYFDWRTPSFKNNATCYPLTQFPSPFYQTGNLEILRVAKDYKPEDGWELIDFDMGYDLLDNPRPVAPQHTHVILYNKLTAVLRILLKTCRKEDYNGVRVVIKFHSTSLFQTGLLDNISSLKSLDLEHIRNPAGQSPSRYLNDDTKWFYADFPMTYDPCTCKYESKLNIISDLIKNSQINLEGTITGTLTTISNGAGQVNSDGNYSFKNFVNDADKFKTVSQTIESFAGSTILGVNSLFPPNSPARTAKSNAINLFTQGLKDKNFLKQGLNFVPWLKEAASLLDFFTAGGNSSTPANQPIKLQPISADLTVKVTGTMETVNQYHNLILSNPGSLNAQLDPANYPYYNEALGVFNLISGPKFKYHLDLQYDEYTYNPNFTIGFKLQNPIKWTINPASDLQIQDAKVAYIAVSTYSMSNPPSTFNGAGTGTEFQFIEGKDAITGNWQYRSEYVDINCLGDNHSFLFGLDGSAPIKYYLKFILNLKRISNPSAQNVPLFLTYPIEVGDEVTDFIPYQMFTPNSCPGGLISQATGTEINDFCASIKYKSNREFRRVDGLQDITEINNSSTMSLKLVPNPSSSFTRIVGDISNKKITGINIYNSKGQIVQSEITNLTGVVDKIINISNLESGIYIVQIINNHKETKVLKLNVLK
jgi:hypothetical protein